MNFGDALANLKNGKKIARKGWNGKGMYLYLESFCNEKFLPCVVMYTANREFQPGWTCSQADMLAEDWEVEEQYCIAYKTKNSKMFRETFISGFSEEDAIRQLKKIYGDDVIHDIPTIEE